MNITLAIKHMMLDKHIAVRDLAEKLGRPETSLSRTLSRSDYGVKRDILEILDALGVDMHVSFTDRETGKQYYIV